MAVYPNGIKQFTTKRDNIDIDYASDINSLQDEVRAIEMALGLNPMTANLNTGSVSYSNVAARLDALEKGENALQNGTPHPSARVYANYMTVPPLSGVQSTLSTIIWDNQGSQADGTGLTIQRTGYYIISASGRFGNVPSYDPGAVQHMSIRLGAHNEVVGAAGYVSSFVVPTNSPGAMRLSASDIIYLTAGTILRWWAWNTSSSFTIPVVNMSLTNWFLSEG